MDWTAGLAGPLQIDTSTWWMALGSAFTIGLLVGTLPAGAAEALALVIGAIPSIQLRIGVLVIFTAGHVLGKALWYSLGTLESRLTYPRLRVWMERARQLAARHPKVGLGVTASSSFASIPPFHLMAVAAGIVHAPPVPFFAVAFAGRLARFAALAAFPSLVRYLLLTWNAG